MCPLDPSRPLSQRKVYVKIREMCQNTAQSMLNIFFYFRSLTAKAPAASFSQLKIRSQQFYFAPYALRLAPTQNPGAAHGRILAYIETCQQKANQNIN